MFGSGFQQQGASQLKAARLEMEAVTNMFSSLTDRCHEKCVLHTAATNGADTDLKVGELACTDRCVAKFLEAQKKVGEIINEFQRQQQQQQQVLQ